MKRYGKNLFLLGLTLLVNLAIFLTIPFLSRVKDLQPAFEIAGSPDIVRLPGPETRGQQPIRSRQPVQEAKPPKRTDSLNQLPGFEISPPPRPKPVLKMPELEFEAPRIELGNLKIQKPSQEKAAPKSRQVSISTNSKAESVQKPRKVKALTSQPKASPTKRQAQNPAVKSGFSLNEVDQKPRIIKKVSPVYPFKARRRNISGQVVLRFLVDTRGRVAQVMVRSAEPQDVFEESALEAVRQWRFEPGQVGGKAVKTWVEVPIRFELEG